MSKNIIAATGCPTGIAHTYMAQEALEQAAEKLNVHIKVETHGQVGIENELSEDDIAQADVVIIAADKDVQAERFVGKKIIDVSVGKGIKQAEDLIQDAIDGKGTIKYQPDSDSNKSSKRKKENKSTDSSLGRQIYKHLMNGVSHMIPFVVGGGVLIAISFLWGIHSADPNSNQYNQIAEMLMDIGGTAMGLMVPVLSAFIADSIARRPGLIAGFVGGMIAHNGETGFLGGIVSGFLAGITIIILKKMFRKLPKSLDGLKAIFLYPLFGIVVTGTIMVWLSAPMEAINRGMIDFLSGFQNSSPIVLGLIVGSMSAFDMGGPVNKAAYVTGTALLADGNTYFMAGVSAACIAPPLMTTVSVLLFPNKYTKEERNSGLVNFILGSTHITEGAIPFAAKNPLRVIPSLMVGSSIAAILTYYFEVQVPAPHGGFLVLPIVTHALLWVIAIAVGSIIGGVMMGYLQNNNNWSKGEI